MPAADSEKCIVPECPVSAGFTVFIDILLISLVLILIFSVILLSSVPPISRDALVHHLAIPKLYIRHGGMYEIPSMIYSYYPMNLDLLYMIPLYFGNDIAPKFIHFGFALATSYLVFHYIRTRMNTTWALLGVLLFLSIPIVVKLSITAYVDLGLIFFSTASLLCLFKWTENGFHVKYIIYSGILCGLALGTKYNGLVVFFLLTLFVPIIYVRCTQNNHPGFPKIFGHSFIFFMTALLLFSPWMIRNFQWRSNPIYPLYDNWIHPDRNVSPKNDSEDVSENAGSGIFSYRNRMYNEDIWQMFLLPVRIFFQGEDGNPRLFDGKLNPFLFFLPFFAFFPLKETQNVKREKYILLFFALLYFSFSFFTTDLRIRYISPMIPSLVILSVFGIKNIFVRVLASPGRALQWSGTAFACLLLIFFLSLNALYVADQFRYVNPLPYLRGTISRDDYISKYRFEYPAMQYINSHLPSDALVLFVFMGDRGYYCDREYIPNGSDQLSEFLKAGYSPEHIYEKLKNKKVSHLLVYFRILNSWADSLSSGDRAVLDEFVKHYLHPVYSKNGVGIFALNSGTGENDRQHFFQ